MVCSSSSRHLLLFPSIRTSTTSAPPPTTASYPEWRWTPTSPSGPSGKLWLRSRTAWRSLAERSCTRSPSQVWPQKLIAALLQDVQETTASQVFLNTNAFCPTVNEVPVYTTESRTLDRRSRGERSHVLYRNMRLQEVNYCLGWQCSCRGSLGGIASEILRLKTLQGENLKGRIKGMPAGVCVCVCADQVDLTLFVRLQAKKWPWTARLLLNQRAGPILWNVSIRCLYCKQINLNQIWQHCPVCERFSMSHVR